MHIIPHRALNDERDQGTRECLHSSAQDPPQVAVHLVILGGLSSRGLYDVRAHVSANAVPSEQLQCP